MSKKYDFISQSTEVLRSELSHLWSLYVEYAKSYFKCLPYFEFEKHYVITVNKLRKSEHVEDSQVMSSDLLLLITVVPEHQYLYS
jgi:hypothetical protein